MGILDSVSGALSNAASWVGDQVDGAVKDGEQLADEAGKALNSAADWAGEKVDDAAHAVTTAAGDARQWVGNRLDDIDHAEQWVGQKIDGAVTSAEHGIDGFRKDMVQFGQEHGGAVGKFVAEQAADGIGVVEGGGLALYGMGKGVVQLADGASKLVNPLEWATHADRNINRLETMGKVGVALGNLSNPAAWIMDPQSNENTAKALWNGVTSDYQAAAKEGDWSKFAGRAVVDIGSFFVGAGEANAVAKTGEAAADLGKVAEATSDVGKVADTAGTLGKSVDGADALGKSNTLDRAGTAAHASEQAGDASHAGTSLEDILKKADTGTQVGGKPLYKFDSLDDFNAVANAAQPNSVYQFGDFRWSTDGEGRVASAEGKVELNPLGRNDPKLQRDIGNEGRSTDVGFHMIADRFGGPTNRLNVVPGNGKPIGDGLANLNNGAFKRFENQIAQLRTDGHTVEMRVRAQYNPGNTTSRPDRFVAEYRTDGGNWISQKFINK